MAVTSSVTRGGLSVFVIVLEVKVAVTVFIIILDGGVRAVPPKYPPTPAITPAMIPVTRSFKVARLSLKPSLPTLENVG